MLVVLDANILVADPTFGGLVWKALAHAPVEWGVKVVVPRVVLVEAQATLARKASDALDAIHKGIEAARRVGLPLPAGFADPVVPGADAIGAALAEQLANLGVEVIDPPDVSHMELVQRAAHRRKPCNEHGDGYRDTLIWLTVLNLASDPDHMIALVTQNVRDFADVEGKAEDKLHPQLAEELVAINATERVTLYRRLDGLVMALAAAHSTSEPSDLNEVGRELERARVVEYLTIEVAPGLVGRSLNPAQCGLPRYVAAASITACHDLDDIEIVVTEPKGAQSLARFTFTATFETAAEVPPPALEDGTGGAHAPERSIQTITKMLRVAGVLTRDTFRRPTSAEVTEVLALPGDPGLEAWRARRTGWTLGDTAFQSNLLKTIADAQRLGPLADPAWLRTQTQLQKAVADFKTPLDTGALANVQKMFDNIQNPLDAGALANIQKMLDNIQMGPTMRAIADAQKLIGQAHLNPIITSALEAARRAELARRSAESEEETNDTGDRGDGDPNEPESGHHTGGDDEHDPPDA